MADYQVIGDRQDLGTTPKGSPASDQKKPVTEQIIGTQVSLNRTAMTSPSALASKGTYQVIGTRCEMTATPNKMVGNSGTLKVSDRAQAASEVGAIPSAKVTRP